MKLNTKKDACTSKELAQCNKREHTMAWNKLSQPENLAKITTSLTTRDEADKKKTREAEMLLAQ